MCTFNCLALSVSANFTIPKPTVTLASNSGRPGNGFNVTGSGFSPGKSLGEQVQIAWDPAGQNLLLYQDVPGTSTFAVGPFIVPNAPPGTYNVRVCDLPVSGAAGSVARRISAQRSSRSCRRLCL